MSDFPRFQYSYFLDNGAQVVVRGNNWDEFRNDLNNAVIQFPTKPVGVATKPAVAPVIKALDPIPANTNYSAPAVEMCIIHNTELKQRISKAGKPYKSHVRKVGEDWDRCFGKGWMSEKDGQSSEEVGKQW